MQDADLIIVAKKFEKEMNSVMNGIEEKQLTKIWLNVFKDFFLKTLL